MKSLDEFLKDVESELKAFEKMWRENHQKNPDMYPMELPTDNEGLWWEQFMTFTSEGIE